MILYCVSISSLNLFDVFTFSLDTASDNWSDDEETENANAGPSTSSNPQQQIRILEKKLIQAQRDLADYRKLVETRFGLSQLAKELSTQNDEPNAIQSGAGRDDDTHYFRSYGEHGKIFISFRCVLSII